jgi:hypothetical protein
LKEELDFAEIAFSAALYQRYPSLSSEQLHRVLLHFILSSLTVSVTYLFRRDIIDIIDISNIIDIINIINIIDITR